MPEQQINTATDEAVVNVPTEGDSVDVDLKEDSKTEVKDDTQPQNKLLFNMQNVSQMKTKS